MESKKVSCGLAEARTDERVSIPWLELEKRLQLQEKWDRGKITVKGRRR
jgi:hypothetical protein